MNDQLAGLKISGATSQSEKDALQRQLEAERSRLEQKAAELDAMLKAQGADRDALRSSHSSPPRYCASTSPKAGERV